MGEYDNYPMGVNGSDDYFDQPDEVEVIDPEADAEAIKRLAVAQALFKQVKSMVATGDEFNLRGEVDAIMARRYYEAKKLGIAPKSFDIELDGEKVGTYSITATEAEPESTSVKLVVENRQELLEWAIENGCATVNMKAVEGAFASTGELPGGCTAVPVTKPAVKAGKIAKTTLRIDPAKVSESLGAGLGEVASYFLEGGEL